MHHIPFAKTFTVRPPPLSDVFCVLSMVNAPYTICETDLSIMRPVRRCGTVGNAHTLLTDEGNTNIRLIKIARRRRENFGVVEAILQWKAAFSPSGNPIFRLPAA